MLLNIFNFVDRNLLIAFAPQIKADFNLTNVEWGLLTGVYFLFFYSVFGIFMGVLGDKFSRMKIAAAGVFLWSLMTAFTGIAKNFTHLIVARALIGVGESALTPNSISMLSDVYDQSKRGTASAIYYLGIPLGVGFGMLIAAYFGPIFGWRTVFISLGIIGMILGIITYFLIEPIRGKLDHSIQNDHKIMSIREIISLTKSTLYKSKSLTFVIVGSIFLHIPLGAGNFEVLWAVNERGFSSSEYNSLFGIFFILGGSVGAILGGVLSDKLSHYFKGGVMSFLTISYLILTPLTISYRFVEPDTFIFYFTLFFISLNVTFFYGPVFASVQALTPVKIRSTMVAIFILGVNIIGMGVGSFVTGYLVDYVFNNSSAPYTYSLITIGATGIISIICFYISGYSYKKDTHIVLNN
ncbi:MFS transporter [Pelagibacteraceae bacterium]|nr:MFS transporter [Pelagibacteraceae bacterium]